MDCLYAPLLDATSKEILLIQDELKHAKALRLKIGEKILLSSGTGFIAMCALQSMNAVEAHFVVHEIRHNIHELPGRLSIAMGILNNKDRMEFAVEKLTELGMTDFYPVVSEYSETLHCDEKRLRSKMISALKQCKRSILPTLHKPLTIKELSDSVQMYDIQLLADISGNVSFNDLLSEKTSSILMYIGPEGGFSANELHILETIPTLHKISLGNRRLRAETAAIALSSIIQFKWQ